MEKETLLRNQIFISIGIAMLIIIGSSFYLFTYFSDFNQQNLIIGKNVQSQLNASTNLNYSLYKAINEAENNNSKKLHFHIALVSQNLNDLKELTPALENKKLNEFIKLSEKIINDAINYDPNRINYNWEEKHEETVLAFNKYIEGIISYRDIKIAENEVNFNNVKQNILICVLACLAIIIYAIYKFYTVIKNLEKSSSELKRLNKELDDARFNIEYTNWILENNTRLTDNIRGIDDTKKIATLVIQTLNEIIPTQAATIYVREPHSYEFKLNCQTGTKVAETIQAFQSGEGYLGKLVDEQKIVVKDIEEFNHLNTTSSLITNFKTKVFICPLVQDHLSIGIIEIAVQIQDEFEIQRLYDFFLRITNTIASKIKFGQNHILVEQLLLEKQRQTEELEAQQEELRITNEELIYKTNLLEASEEELSAQQEELSKTNNELTHKAEELEKRNLELNNAQQIVEQKIKEIEAASKYKTEFMANMSHELRTPLNSILLLAKLLQDNKQNNLNAEEIKYASVIYSAGSDLLELIDDLLDLAKIEAGKVELHNDTISTISFANKIHELFAAISNEKEIDFQVIIDPKVPNEFTTDEYRLQQIIKNFLSNAFKFTENKGKVTFSISAIDKKLCFKIEDTGKGISKEKQKLIFEAFKQEDGSTSRKYGGTGLGLSISKNIATLLNGEITLSSELGKGSIFTVIIPELSNKEENTYSKEDQKPTPTKAEPFLKNKNKTLLIIEDDINFADTLKTFAEEYNFTTYIAHDGLNGIKLAHQILPDAIIIDVVLPLKDGWEVLKELKNNPKTEHIPIHMMSGTKYDKKELLEKGVISFMHKPVTKKIIQETFDKINSNQSIRKILIIENQGYDNDCIKNIFSEQNILISQTHSIEEGIEQLKITHNIDCIVINSPLLNDASLKTLARIRQVPGYTEIPLIIYSEQQLSEEKKDEIISYTGPTIFKSEKLNSKHLDEIDLFLNNLKNPSAPLFQKTSNAKSLVGKTVLIADDDMRNIFALSTSLENYGMKIEVANTGKEAIDILEKKEIDIVLMDIMMPEMDGYEAMQIIRNELKLETLPIIAVTAKAMKGDKEKTIQYGANDYISKPVDLNKLISLLNVWIS